MKAIYNEFFYKYLKTQQLRKIHKDSSYEVREVIKLN